MDWDLRESYKRCCRLCAKEQEVTIMIYSAEAESMLLQSKLNKYLLIEVDEDDKLPKNICINCCTKLETVCDFIDTARNAQEVLLNRSIFLEQYINNDVISPIKCESKKELESFVEDDNNVLEMEVSVDPMVVIQNSERSPLTNNDDCNDQNDHQCNTDEDITYLPSADGENVTIKLIRKGVQELDDTDKLKKPFPCKICNRSYYSDLALQNHSWMHHKKERIKKVLTCRTCGECFYYKNTFITHLRTHKTIVQCQLCSRQFRTVKTLQQHLDTHTTQKMSYVCKVCGRLYKTKSNLKTHTIAHSSERPFRCLICKKRFKRNQDLKFHINQHTGAKPYKCPFCEKSFASSGNCYSHRHRMHPGQKPEPTVKIHELATCEKQQPVTDTPKSSLTIVNGMYKYQCHFCKHSFLKKDNYTYHMYQHTGQRPFQCTFCTARFVTRRGIQLHHDKEHPGEDRPLSLLTKNVLLM